MCFNKIKLIILAFSLALPFVIQNQIYAQEPSKIFIGESINIRSEILDEDRSLLIYTPANYDSSEGRYPVLYLLDGATHFVHVTGIVHYLADIGRIPPMIMVAIPNTNRYRDLSPFEIENAPQSGGADNFLRFISEELTPYIDKNYRTQPYKIIAGHSLGGAFAVNAMLTQPQIFEGYIIISPALGLNDGQLIKDANTFFMKKARFKKFLYLTLGDEGENSLLDLKKFTDIISRTKPKGFEWDFRRMKNETHGTIPHRSIYDGLEKLYSDWTVTDEIAADGLEPVKDHFRKLSKKFGYEITIPENILNNLGYQFLNINDFDEALSIFKFNVKSYPNSANVYDSYGEALEKDGQLKKALENYEIAYTKGKESSHPFENIFKENSERIKRYLEEDN